MDKNQPKPKTGLKLKIITIICLVGGVVVIIGVFFGYYTTKQILLDTITHEHLEVAKRVSLAISDRINNQVKSLKITALRNLWAKAIREKNLSYAGMNSGDIKEYLLDMDRKWSEAKDNSLLVGDYLDNVSAGMASEIVKENTAIAELFATDKFGGLVFSSGKTSDFYQADEEWWQKAYANGAGNTYIGQIELDKSSNVESVTIAVPLKDGKGVVIGIIKKILQTDSFFAPLTRVKIGKTGHAMLVNNDGMILCHHNRISIVDKFANSKVFKQLTKSKTGWSILKNIQPGNSDIFTCFAKIENEFLSANNTTWWVFINQEAKEIFLPLSSLLTETIVFTIFLLVLLAVFGIILGAVFMRPIIKLREATDAISQRDLDYKVEIKTGDELEQLADSFNQMVEKLSNTTVSYEVLANEMSLRQAAEKSAFSEHAKLKSKTEELSRSLKETLASREAIVSVLNDNIKIKDKLEMSMKELKDAQAQLIQSEKMDAIGQMASGIAHEVKNPLGVVLQGVNYFEENLPLKQTDNRKILKMMKDGVKRADSIVRALLDFSRAAEIDLVKDDIDLVLIKAVDLTRHHIVSKNIKLITELEKHLPKVLIDRNKLIQVFINLMLNSAQSITDSGSIIVRSCLQPAGELNKKANKEDTNSFQPEEKAIIIEIEDNGCGISKEIMKKIFDPFFTTKKRTEGTGLGLSVAKSIIDMHGGFMRVESGLGKGTKVTISLRLPKDE